MKKLLNMIGAMTLIGTASTSVIACGGGETPTPPTPDTRTDISTIITNKELGIIGINPEVNPTSENIKNKIKSKNLALDINAISISSITSTNATITGNGKYKGNVIVNYKINKNKKDLSMITQLTGLNITANPSETYFKLWEKIKIANEFINKKDIFKSWKFSVFNNTFNKVTSQKQKSGIIYIIISITTEKDLYWMGQTPRLKVILK